MYIVPVQAAPAPPSFPLSPVRQGSKRGGEQEEVGGKRIKTVREQELAVREREEQELAAREQVELAMAREQEELHIVAREQEELAMARE